MDCINCRHNQAVKTYYETKNGKRRAEYYCLECYHRLFLSAEEAEGGVSLSACPYCGMKTSEIEKRKLVGCANCYKVLSDKLVPLVVKMQQCEKAHRGKIPPLDGCGEDLDAESTQTTDAFFEQKILTNIFQSDIIVTLIKRTNLKVCQSKERWSA